MALAVHLQNIWPAPHDDRMLGSGMADVYTSTEELIASVLGPEDTITVGYNAASTYETSCLALEAFNNIGMLEGLIAAERAGSDVALVLCGNDPVLRAGRAALKMPVVGITESAMLVACTLGHRFGAITMDEASVPLVEYNLESYGLRSRAVSHRPVRSPAFYEDMSRWFRDPEYLADNVIPRFEAVANGLIADGAEVIVTACGGYAILPIVGYSRVTGTDVPIVDATLAGAHMARLLGSLRREFNVSTSKAGGYHNPLQDPGGDLLTQLLSGSRYPLV